MKGQDAAELLVEKERFEEEYQAYLSLLINEEDEMQHGNMPARSKNGGDMNVNTA